MRESIHSRGILEKSTINIQEMSLFYVMSSRFERQKSGFLSEIFTPPIEDLTVGKNFRPFSFPYLNNQDYYPNNQDQVLSIFCAGERHLYSSHDSDSIPAGQSQTLA